MFIVRIISLEEQFPRPIDEFSSFIHPSSMASSRSSVWENPLLPVSAHLSKQNWMVIPFEMITWRRIRRDYFWTTIEESSLGQKLRSSQWRHGGFNAYLFELIKAFLSIDALSFQHEDQQRQSNGYVKLDEDTIAANNFKQKEVY